MEEIWKDIKDYEGLYEVSNFGRVRSLKYGKERVLRIQKHRCGYQLVFLCKEGKLKGFVVHRLVAEAFIPNPYGLPEVNHIDEDKTNNSVENLEWCDRIYNMRYGTRNERIIEKLGKTIYQYTKSGSFIRSYASTREAERQSGINQSDISRCCNSKRKSAGNYIWSFIPPTPSTTRVLW